MPDPVRVLVVGLGDPLRGDDGVGAAVVRALAGLPAPHLDVTTCRQPLDLLDLWDGRGTVVVVDAVRSDAPAGTVHRLVPVRDGVLAPPDGPASRGPATGTHGLDLGGVLGLGAAVRRLPGRLVVIGVSAASFGRGEPLSAPVADAVPGAVRAVLDEVGTPRRTMPMSAQPGPDPLT